VVGGDGGFFCKRACVRACVRCMVPSFANEDRNSDLQNAVTAGDERTNDVVASVRPLLRRHCRGGWVGGGGGGGFL
jgi:hypothetical protein